MQITDRSLGAINGKVLLASNLALAIASLEGLRLIFFILLGLNPYSTIGHIMLVIGLALRVFRTAAIGPLLMLSRMVVSAIVTFAMVVLANQFIGIPRKKFSDFSSDPAPVFLFAGMLLVAVGFGRLFAQYRPPALKFPGTLAAAVSALRWNSKFHYLLGSAIVLLQLLW